MDTAQQRAQKRYDKTRPTGILIRLPAAELARLDAIRKPFDESRPAALTRIVLRQLNKKA